MDEDIVEEERSVGVNQFATNFAYLNAGGGKKLERGFVLSNASFHFCLQRLDCRHIGGAKARRRHGQYIPSRHRPIPAALPFGILF